MICPWLGLKPWIWTTVDDDVNRRALALQSRGEQP